MVDVPTQIPNTENFISIVAGESFSLALDSSGSIWSFGYNLYGRLGVGDEEQRTRPTKIEEFLKSK